MYWKVQRKNIITYISVLHAIKIKYVKLQSTYINFKLAEIYSLPFLISPFTENIES